MTLEAVMQLVAVTAVQASDPHLCDIISEVDHKFCEAELSDNTVLDAVDSP